MAPHDLGRSVPAIQHRPESPPANELMAPVYSIPPKDIIAVEHPMHIRNLDLALATFGTNRPFRRIIDSDDPEECLPLYLRPDDPMCVPLLSHNGASNNVVLQITVPKPTGKKRKRGSREPYMNQAELSPERARSEALPTVPSRTCSSPYSKDPTTLQKMLKDNKGKYSLEVIGHVNQTHRFRGLSDFQQSTGSGRFISRMEESMLTGEVAKMFEFEFDPNKGTRHNEEILPPPLFTGHSLPFNWAWHQNPNIFLEKDPTTGEQVLINHSKPGQVHAHYVPHDVEALALPSGPPSAVPDEPYLRALVADLNGLFEERPIWTRRGLSNHIGDAPYYYLLRQGLQYVGYMFKGGPFRDAIIRYGVDPRADKRFRPYQTIFQQIETEDARVPEMPWQDDRQNFQSLRQYTKPPVPTHQFDGKTLTVDGKIWQVCDIIDPFLARLIKEAPYPDTFHPVDGWFTNGAFAKIKHILKIKILALRINRSLEEADFAATLEVPDIQDAAKSSRKINLPVPDVKFTDEEIKGLREKGVRVFGKSNKLRAREQRKLERSKNGRRRYRKHNKNKDRKVDAPRPQVKVLPSEIWSTDKTFGVIEAGSSGDVNQDAMRSMKIIPTTDVDDEGAGAVERESEGSDDDDDDDDDDNNEEEQSLSEEGDAGEDEDDDEEVEEELESYRF